VYPEWIVTRRWRESHGDRWQAGEQMEEGYWRCGLCLEICKDEEEAALCCRTLEGDDDR
jgi:hypothetical protein